jgi:hypothetical protein
MAGRDEAPRRQSPRETGRDQRRRLLKPKRSWEIQASVAIAWVRNAADEALARDVPRDEIETRGRAYANVTAHLDLAAGFLKQRGTPRTWWLGTRVEGAWAHIHAAKVKLIGLLDDERLLAYSPRVLSLVHLYLTPTDAERIAVNWWFDQLEHRPIPVIVTGSLNAPEALRGPVNFEGSIATNPPGPLQLLGVAEQKAAALATALQASYERIAAHYQRLRRFQFSLIGSAAAVLLVVGALWLIGWRNPDVVPLCFPDPRAANAEADDQTTTGEHAVCPSSDAPQAADNPTPASSSATNADGSDAMPSAGDVPTVVLFGLLGASMTSISLVVRKAPPSSVPMASIRVSQAVLKAATGMMTAVLGLLFLRAGVIPGFTQVDTRSQILVYAVVFGAAQQLVTRFIDSRSNELLAAVTSTDEDDDASA